MDNCNDKDCHATINSRRRDLERKEFKESKSVIFAN